MNSLKIPHFVYVAIDDSGQLSMPAKEGDVGYDAVAISDPVIVGVESLSTGKWLSIDYIEYELGIKVDGFQPMNSPHEDIFTLVFPRSSLSKYNLILANSVGVIDSGFRGAIKVRFKYVFQPSDFFVSSEGNIYGSVDESKIYKKGDKICQFVFQKHFHPLIEVVDELEPSERNEGGFGSTSL